MTRIINRRLPTIVFILYLASLCLFLGSCSNNPQTADLILINGKIATMDEAVPEAQAMAIADGWIIAIGSNANIKTFDRNDVPVIDLEGQLAIPGFIEGHAHFLGLGYAKMKLDLTTAGNWDEILVMVEQAVAGAQPGEWILGRGWHQEKWDRTPLPNVDGLPYNDELSRITPDNPVYLTHASGHSAIVNARAMHDAKITAGTPDPDGGELIRDGQGKLIGVFLETAMDLIDAARSEYLAYRTPDQETEEKRRAIDLAVQECLSHGVTGFHDAGASFASIDQFRDMAVNGELDIRLWVMISEDNDSLARRLSDYRIIGLGDNHLTVRAIKRVFDGALGSHGAWLLEPYDDLKSSTGLNTEPVETMRETARLALEHGFQLCTHAIGDRANRETLDLYEEAFNAAQSNDDLRWRIEHAQHLDPADIPRFGQLRVIASMQGIHCTSDGPWVPKRIGPQRSSEGAYVWQKLLNTGAIICNGTDAPVEKIDPIANFHALVTRQMSNGEVFYGDQVMTREQALRAYTYNCALAAYEEDIKGSLAVGKLADITVLSRDIMTIPAEEILETEIVYTIVGGNVLYKK